MEEAFLKLRNLSAEELAALDDGVLADAVAFAADLSYVAGRVVIEDKFWLKKSVVLSLYDRLAREVGRRGKDWDLNDAGEPYLRVLGGV